MGRKNQPTEAFRRVSIDTSALALSAYHRLIGKHPQILKEASAYQRSRVRDDLVDHLDALADAIATDSPAIFTDYADRAQIFFISRHLPEEYIPDSFKAILEGVPTEFPEEYRDIAKTYLRKGLTVARKAQAPPSCINPENPQADAARNYLDALVDGDAAAAQNVIDTVLASGTSIKEVYLNIFRPVLAETGRLWLIEKIGIAAEHFISASVVHELGRLSNQIAREGRLHKKGKTVVAASVEGEHHGIGIQMVSDFFIMDGWNSYYVGPDIPARSLLKAIRDRHADVIALSISLPSRLQALHYLIRSLRGDPATASVKIIVGGRPFVLVPGLWKQLDADACARDAAEAVAAADRLIKN